MPDDAALGIAIDQATKLAEKWICQPRPNEDASQWNLDKIDQVARDIVALSSIDRKLLISKAAELATMFSAPDIPYQDHSKEVVALGAVASNLLAALLQIALRAHEAGLTGNVNFRIYRDATEYADIISNIEAEIQEANRKIDSLQHQISKDRKVWQHLRWELFRLTLNFCVKYLRKP